VVRDLAVMIAGGGTAISDRAVLRDQPNLFGEVASTPTAWRTLEAIDIAHDLLVWCQHLCLDGDLARAEPKRLRYTLLHTAGIIARTGRQTRLPFSDGSPVGGRGRPRAGMDSGSMMSSSVVLCFARSLCEVTSQWRRHVVRSSFGQ